MNNLDEIKQWIKTLNYTPDERHYNLEKMDIFDIFNWMWETGYIDDDEVLYKLVNFIKNNNLID